MRTLGIRKEGWRDASTIVFSELMQTFHWLSVTRWFHSVPLSSALDYHSPCKRNWKSKKMPIFLYFGAFIWRNAGVHDLWQEGTIARAAPPAFLSLLLSNCYLNLRGRESKDFSVNCNVKCTREMGSKAEVLKDLKEPLITFEHFWIKGVLTLWVECNSLGCTLICNRSPLPRLLFSTGIYKLYLPFLSPNFSSNLPRKSLGFLVWVLI